MSNANSIIIHFDSCDSRSHASADSKFSKMRTAAIEHFGRIGASVRDSDRTYCINICKPDARGLVASARAFCRSSVYFEII